jgi:hypothetical protein
MPSDNQIETTEVVFGQVVNVRPVPTRGVTQVIIEVPSECHVKTTAMVFGKDAFLFSARPGLAKPYGIYPLDKIDEPGPLPDGGTGRPTQFKRNGVTHSVPVVQWLGVHCQNARFMNWLGVENASAAAQRVRELCGVDSRSKIPGNPEAEGKFFSHIFNPYQAHSSALR